VNEVTLDHVRQACEWAERAGEEPQPIDGATRRYNQGNWDCGTSCCVWGAAHLIAGNGPAQGGPPREWVGQSLRHTVVAGLLQSGRSTPAQIALILSGADLRGADLSGAYLSEAYLSGADLTRADLSGADLSGARYAPGG
jgi:hypothetical protein